MRWLALAAVLLALAALLRRYRARGLPGAPPPASLPPAGSERYLLVLRVDPTQCVGLAPWLRALSDAGGALPTARAEELLPRLARAITDSTHAVLLAGRRAAADPTVRFDEQVLASVLLLHLDFAEPVAPPAERTRAAWRDWLEGLDPRGLRSLSARWEVAEAGQGSVTLLPWPEPTAEAPRAPA